MVKFKIIFTIILGFDILAILIDDEADERNRYRGESKWLKTNQVIMQY